jgi:hypothetical protein
VWCSAGRITCLQNRIDALLAESCQHETGLENECGELKDAIEEKAGLLKELKCLRVCEVNFDKSSKFECKMRNFPV